MCEKGEQADEVHREQRNSAVFLCKDRDEDAERRLFCSSDEVACCTSDRRQGSDGDDGRL